MNPPTVGIVGGGILGTVLALRLTEAGARVTLLERAPELGGLAGALELNGHLIDRFYHVITPSDTRMIDLAGEVGLGEELRFSPVGVGFHIDGANHDFNGVADFLRFSPLSPTGRARLAAFVAQCQLRGDYAGLEDVALDAWLTRWCGAEVVRRIWRPLLDSRFEGRHDELPATYMWARTRRMTRARTGASRRETMGHVIGGHARLIASVAQRAAERGATIRAGADVQGLLTGPDGRVTGIRVAGDELAFDQVIVTLQPPALRHLLPPSLLGLLDAYPQRYLGVVCAILEVRRSLLPYYTINICDPTPITTVVETSHVVGTEHTEGLRLIYLPRYCDPGAPEQTEDDASVLERFCAMLARIAPGFDRGRDVVAETVQRARLVEPVHARGVSPRVPPLWPDAAPGLGLASAAQVYPRLLNGESIVELAERVAAEARERLGMDRAA